MPFKSESQRRWMYANKPALARKWSAKYHNEGSLIVAPDVNQEAEELIQYFENGGLTTAQKRKLARHGTLDKASQRSNEGSKAITPRDILDFVPIVGDALAAKDIYDEMQKDEPNWYVIGVLTAGTAVGLIPGIGDAAAKAIKSGGKALIDGSKKAMDVLKQYEITVDPSSLGSNFGNIQFRKKADLMREVPSTELPTPKSIEEAVARNQNLAQQLDEADAIYEYSKTGVVPDYSGRIGKVTPKGSKTKVDKDTAVFDIAEDTRDAKHFKAESVFDKPKETYTKSEDVVVKPLYAKEIKTGIPEVDSIAPMIQSFAKKVPIEYREEAIQDGIVAAIEASMNYRKGSNVPFSTYAYDRVRFAIQNRTGITDPVKRAEAIKVDKTSAKLDATISDSEGVGRSISEIIPSESLKDFYDELPAEYRQLARLLNEQYESKLKGGKVVREGGKTKRIKVVKDKDIAADLGISLEEFKKQKDGLANIMKDYINNPEIVDLLYRKPGKYKDPLFDPKAKPGASKQIVKDGKFTPNATPDEIKAVKQAQETGQPVTFCIPINKQKGGLVANKCFEATPDGLIKELKEDYSWADRKFELLEQWRKDNPEAIGTAGSARFLKENLSPLTHLRRIFQEMGTTDSIQEIAKLTKTPKDIIKFRKQFMSPEELAIYDKLPEKVKVYRLQTSEGELGPSWTLSKDPEHIKELTMEVTQKQIANEEGGWDVLEAVVDKEDIVGVLGSAGQVEAVINPNKLNALNPKVVSEYLYDDYGKGSFTNTFNKGGLIAY